MLKKILAIAAMLYAAATFAAVDVNKATAADLDGLKGIGPSISTRILDERKKGNFKDWTDFIERIKGVGEGNAAKFSAEGMTVNGEAYKGANALPAKAETKKEAKAAKADAKPAAVTTTAAPAAAAAPAPVAKADAKPTADEAKAKKAAEKQAKADAKKAKAEEAKAKKEAAAAKPVAAASAAK
ncbi:hypothetical protein RD110_21745 [Rhodoferax koreense]|uniref:DNA uptake protein n=1 Tax=Rhodoferax koreensis TaxID=1842727 RepID=A0A1P8K0I9_9BURK|nr:helix-hairpin-helix domain-containing protein [Rhodoferax koreense]APW39516.1 hypothetical protein RD110_21745 [Rhodoferax koreense]